MPIKGNRSNINATFLARVDKWNDACGGRYSIGTGFRSIQEQARLYALKQAGKIKHAVARPGHSWHEGRGRNMALAIDLEPDATMADQRAAASFGLCFPVRGEPWHIQPVETLQGAAAIAKLGGSSGIVGSVPDGTVPAGAVPGGVDVLGFVQDGMPNVIKYLAGIVLVLIALVNITAPVKTAVLQSTKKVARTASAVAKVK